MPWKGLYEVCMPLAWISAMCTKKARDSSAKEIAMLGSYPIIAS